MRYWAQTPAWCIAWGFLALAVGFVGDRICGLGGGLALAGVFVGGAFHGRAIDLLEDRRRRRRYIKVHHRINMAPTTDGYVYVACSCGDVRRFTRDVDEALDLMAAHRAERADFDNRECER